MDGRSKLTNQQTNFRLHRLILSHKLMSKTSAALMISGIIIHMQFVLRHKRKKILSVPLEGMAAKGQKEAIIYDMLEEVNYICSRV